jgi:ABC-2 type transport system ATP-binding protein
MPIIRVEQLAKHFRVAARPAGRLAALRQLFSAQYTLKQAVDGISFAIEPGELVGFVGPNGAGKSTTIKMLTGVLVPSAGTLEVAGRVPHLQRNEHVRHIGVVFGQKTQLWWDVPVIDSLLLLKDIYKIPEATYAANIAMFNDLLGLHEFQHTPVRQLSLGLRMRADLTAALLHSPDVLFLDEPTIGVDVVTKERLRAFIRTLSRERQVTVLLTTHDMSDIEKVCGRMLIIDTGRIIYDGAVAGMRERFTPYRTLVVDVADGEGEITSERAALLERNGQRVRLRFDRRQVSASELIVELAGKYAVKDIGVEEPEIEAIVREIYERGVQGDAARREENQE